MEYVELVPHLREDRWRLVNRQISKGRVKLGEDDLEELIRERIRHLLQRQLPLQVPGQVCETLLPLLSDITASYQATILRDFGEVEEGAFPPCLQALVNAITAGTNLPHAGQVRHHRIPPQHRYEPGPDRGDLCPGTGLRCREDPLPGGAHLGPRGTEYTAPSCATLRTTGFCVMKDSLCDRVNHPLSYYRIKKKRERGREKDTEKEKEPVTKSSP